MHKPKFSSDLAVLYLLVGLTILGTVILLVKMSQDAHPVVITIEPKVVKPMPKNSNVYVQAIPNKTLTSAVS